MKVPTLALSAVLLAIGVVGSEPGKQTQSNNASTPFQTAPNSMRGKKETNAVYSPHQAVSSEDSYEDDYNQQYDDSVESTKTSFATSRSSPYSVAGAASRGYGSHDKLSQWAKQIEQTTLAAISMGTPKILSLYIILISLLTVVPFGWFTFAGQAAPLNKYYQSVSSSFGAQVVALSLLDSFGLPEWVVATGALASFLGMMYCGTKESNCANCRTLLDCWFGVILVTFVLVIASPFIVLNSQVVFWIVVGLLSYMMTFAMPMLPYEKAQVEGFQIAVISGYGLTSALVVLMSLFGVGGSLDFYSFFSVPSTFSFSSSNSVYLLILVGTVAFGTYINGIRDKKLRA